MGVSFFSPDLRCVFFCYLATALKCSKKQLKHPRHCLCHQRHKLGAQIFRQLIASASEFISRSKLITNVIFSIRIRTYFSPTMFRLFSLPYDLPEKPASIVKFSLFPSCISKANEIKKRICMFAVSIPVTPTPLRS